MLLSELFIKGCSTSERSASPQPRPAKRIKLEPLSGSDSSCSTTVDRSDNSTVSKPNDLFRLKLLSAVSQNQVVHSKTVQNRRNSSSKTNNSTLATHNISTPKNNTTKNSESFFATSSSDSATIPKLAEVSIEHLNSTRQSVLVNSARQADSTQPVVSTQVAVTNPNHRIRQNVSITEEPVSVDSAVSSLSAVSASPPVSTQHTVSSQPAVSSKPSVSSDTIRTTNKSDQFSRKNLPSEAVESNDTTEKSKETSQAEWKESSEAPVLIFPTKTVILKPAESLTLCMNYTGKRMIYIARSKSCIKLINQRPIKEDDFYIITYFAILHCFCFLSSCIIYKLLVGILLIITE